MSLPPDERAKLIALATASVAATVTGDAPPTVDDALGALGEMRGCFVTLTNAGRLRGCIGTFQPDRPLGEMIVQMGASAARDPRFVTDPITPAELPDLTLEVSVLSALERTDRPEQLELGAHGIYITQGMRSGCFLPEVATDHHMDVEEFLDTCCQHKAGLPAGAWRDADTTVYLFTSEKFRQ